jgi:hypothetical protein
VVVGVVRWIKQQQQRFDKTFATAFRAANSSLKNFGFRAGDPERFFNVLFVCVGRVPGAWGNLT